MKEIPLTQGKVAIVDDSDYEYLMQWKWCYHKHPSRSTGYAVRCKTISFKNKILWSMHRELMSPVKGEHVDHINSNGVDNRKSNLRICTRDENRLNKGKNKNNTTGFKGVWLVKRNNTYVAQLNIKGVAIKKYGFKTADDAHEYYKKLALEYHGEFAKW